MSVIDLRRETPDVAKHIVDSINAMANIKKEQINIQKSLMLDKIERERNLETRGKEKQQDVDFQNKQMEGFWPTSPEAVMQGAQSQPQMPTAQNRLPAMSLIGGGVGDVTGTPTAENRLPAMSMAGGGEGVVSGTPIQSVEPQAAETQTQPVVIDGRTYPTARELGKMMIASGEKPNIYHLQMYDAAYNQFARGNGNEGGKKIMNDTLGIKLDKATATDLSDISSEDQIKARALARRVAGVRGAESILPAIVAGMREGKSVDEIEDLIRFSGQSAEFAGPVRDAAQEILIATSPSISEKTMDYIDDELAKGNITGVKSKLKRSARESAGTEMNRSIMGKERTVEFLGEIQEDLDILQKNGVDTGIFNGTLEDINARVGWVKNPELRKVATKIKTAIQNYRRSMSGVAFSVPEAKEYKDLFPSISRVSNFNEANIDALKEVMQGDLDNFYGLSMGLENYQKLFGDTGNTDNGGQGTYQVGQVIQGADGKNYRIIGGDPSDPDVEEVQ